MNQTNQTDISQLEKTMYALGEIMARVYGDKQMPQTVLDQMLINPTVGIGLMSRRPEMLQADQEEMARLVSRLPSELPKEVKGCYRGSFWIGYYHYKKNQADFDKFGREAFQAAGKLLYGEQWQSDMARALGVDSRRIRHWLADTRKMPFGVYIEILALLEERKIDIADALNTL